MKKPCSSNKELSLYSNTGIEKVQRVLVRFPEREFSLSDLAQEAGVAKANIGKILEWLYKIDFIRIEKLTKIWRIRANQGSPNYTKIKIIFNLTGIYMSGLIETLNEKYRNPKAIILFGSYRKGEDISTSDIDIAIEMDEITKYKTVRIKELETIEKKLCRKIQIHFFNRKAVDINLFNNIANGIVLSGFLEVRP